jgi:hypothetical protein
MNLVNDLGNDLANVFLVERKYEKRVNAARMREIINEVRSILLKTEIEEMSENTSAKAANTSH